jgi:hypothetical protein
MSDKQIRIFPTRREVDTDRLAMALLDLVAKLSPEDKARYQAEGDKVMKKLGLGATQKGSAA